MKNNIRYSTRIKFVKNYDEYSNGDEILAGQLDLSLVDALINEGKAEIIIKKADPKPKKEKKQDEKKEVKDDDNSLENSADSGADNDDGSEKPPSD